MNIGLMHFRVHETDGVSLEMEKWKTVVERNGHNVFYIAHRDGEDTHGIPELDINTSVHKKIVQNAYDAFYDYPNEKAFINEIEIISKSIEKQLNILIKTLKIDLLVINNVSSLGMHLPAGLAISRLDDTRLNIAFHHHDFHWERERYQNPTIPYVEKLLETVFPPVHMKAKHFVINKIAQGELKRRKELDSVVVPNVFDFDQPEWTIDAFNEDLRSTLGIKPHDIMLLQGTRIVDRKAIEFAVDVAAELQSRVESLEGKYMYKDVPIRVTSAIHLVVAGMNEMNDVRYNKLLHRIETKNVRAHFINDKIAASRKTHPDKQYSLWDVYPHADAVTYPSILEGWGNQFIEAVYAKKPVVCYEYPVFQTDIAPLGFEVISLGNTYKIENDGLYGLEDKTVKDAVDGLVGILLDKDRYSAVTTHNYAIAEKELSFSKLEEILKARLLDCLKD